MLQVSNEKIPTNIYQALRVQTGLSEKSVKATEIGLSNTLHSVSVKNGDHEYIGMGRLVGDGGCFCQVVDICVLPAWQGKGIGQLIMQDIMNFIHQELPVTCYISLLADGEASRLYEKFGFKDTLPQSKGMFVRK